MLWTDCLDPAWNEYFIACAFFQRFKSYLIYIYFYKLSPLQKIGIVYIRKNNNQRNIENET